MVKVLLYYYPGKIKHGDKNTTLGSKANLGAARNNNNDAEENPLCLENRQILKFVILFMSQILKLVEELQRMLIISVL